MAGHHRPAASRSEATIAAIHSQSRQRISETAVALRDRASAVEPLPQAPPGCRQGPARPPAQQELAPHHPRSGRMVQGADG